MVARPAAVSRMSEASARGRMSGSGATLDVLHPVEGEMIARFDDQAMLDDELTVGIGKPPGARRQDALDQENDEQQHADGEEERWPERIAIRAGGPAPDEGRRDEGEGPDQPMHQTR